MKTAWENMIKLGTMSVADAVALNNAWPQETRSLLAIRFIVDANSDEKQVDVFVNPPPKPRKPRAPKKPK